MSEKSDDLSREEILDIFGATDNIVQTNPDEMAVVHALMELRSQLMSAAEDDCVGTNQLSRRLGVAPSSVSRCLAGDGDMRVSTAVLYARALGRYWTFELKRHGRDEPNNSHPEEEKLRIIKLNNSLALPGSIKASVLGDQKNSPSFKMTEGAFPS